MKKLRERTLWFTTATSIFMVIMVFVVLYNQRVLMIRQEQEIAELNQTIGEYRINEEWFDDYIELLDEIYQGKINEAVLEERVKWLENAQNENVPIDIYDDFWLVEIVSREPFGENQYYYQIKVVGTEDYGYQVSSELFSIGELALAVEFEDNYVIMIDFNN